MSAPARHAWERPAELSVVSELAGEAAGVLRSWGVDDARVRALELAITELGTNLCRHGYRHVTGLMRLVLELDDDALSISIHDQGLPFDPSAVPDPPDPDPGNPDSWPEGGMGLLFVRAACDRIDYVSNEHGNVLTMIVGRVRETTG